MSSSFDAPTDDEAESAEITSTKRIKSQPPDVIVSVGSGESAQEFECYKVILSFASDYFDTMLSSKMKEGTLGRIEFPNKDPEEWKLFYGFIAPHRIGKSRDYDDEITSDNVKTLLPWFHEFQMSELVEECDECIVEELDCKKDPRHFWKPDKNESESEEQCQERLKKRKAAFEELLSLAEMASVYNLKSTLTVVRGRIAWLMEAAVFTSDLFDLSKIKTLLQMVSPIQLDGDELKMSDGGSKRIWTAFKKIISPHISSLSQEIINDMSTFPLLVFSFMQIQIEKDRVSSASRIINKFILEYPKDNNAHYRKFLSIVKSRYKSDEEHFRRVGIRLPRNYDN